MIRKILPLLISMFLLSQSALFGQTQPLPVYEDADAYEVYSAILSNPIANRAQQQKNYVIRLETIRNFGSSNDAEPPTSTCLRPYAESVKIIGTAIDDYVKVNQTKWRLQEKFKLEIPYQLVSSEIFTSLIKTEGVQSFYKRFPDSGGFIDFSAVGFNEDKTVAVFSRGKWCGLLCGNGDFQILQKKDGKWIPLKWVGQRCSWAS